MEKSPSAHFSRNSSETYRRFLGDETLLSSGLYTSIRIRSLGRGGLGLHSASLRLGLSSLLDGCKSSRYTHCK